MNATTKYSFTRERNLPIGWKMAKLGDCLRLRREVVYPRDNPEGLARFVGLEHIESGTGLRTGEVELNLAELGGRKPRFCEGDIVYGYLRPYLNKVWVAEFNGLCSVDQYVFTVREDRVDAQFLAWFMRSPVYLARAPVSTTPGQLPRIRTDEVASVPIELPPVEEQKRIARMLNEQLAAVERARVAAQVRLEASMALPAALVRESLRNGRKNRLLLGKCLVEVKNGVGNDWSNYPVLGATRQGLAPAKENVGKDPERYKVVDPVTVFYNPMRILLGSIALVDDADEPGITSPDYVVVKGRPGILDTRWFYYWFRSAQGAHLIDALSRGAVRERILFNRLATGEIELPDCEAQVAASQRMKKVTALVKSTTNELDAIDALPSAILRRAFDGER
jgi:type I restriction enzyme, S subunit